MASIKCQHLKTNIQPDGKIQIYPKVDDFVLFAGFSLLPGLFK